MLKMHSFYEKFKENIQEKVNRILKEYSIHLGWSKIFLLRFTGGSYITLSLRSSTGQSLILANLSREFYNLPLPHIPGTKYNVYSCGKGNCNVKDLDVIESTILRVSYLAHL